GRSDVLLGVGRWELHRGPLVVRPDRAACKQEGAGERKLARAHAPLSPACAAPFACRALRPVRRMKNRGTNSVATKVAASMPPSTPVPMERRAAAPAPEAKGTESSTATGSDQRS